MDDKKKASDGIEARRSERESMVEFIRHRPWGPRAGQRAEKREIPWEIAWSFNISAAGVGLTAPCEYPAGSSVSLEMAAGDATFKAVGRVAHVTRLTEKMFRIGIEFVVVPPDVRALLERLREKDDSH